MSENTPAAPGAQLGDQDAPRTDRTPDDSDKDGAQARPHAMISLFHAPDDTGYDLRCVDAAVRTAGRTAGLVDLDAEPGRIVWVFDRPLTELAPLIGELAGLARPWWSFSLATVRWAPNPELAPGFWPLSRPGVAGNLPGAGLDPGRSCVQRACAGAGADQCSTPNSAGSAQISRAPEKRTNRGE